MRVGCGGTGRGKEIRDGLWSGGGRASQTDVTLTNINPVSLGNYVVHEEHCSRDTEIPLPTPRPRGSLPRQKEKN